MLDIPEPSMLYWECTLAQARLSLCRMFYWSTKISWHYVRRQFNFNRAGSHALHACAHPEYFVRGGSESGPKCHYKWTTIGPSAKRLWNGVLLACQWPTIECWLGSFVSFRGSGSILLGNPIFLWFLRGGGGGGPDPLVPPLDPPMACTWKEVLVWNVPWSSDAKSDYVITLGIVCRWSGTSDDLLITGCKSRERERERERERLHGVCTWIFCFGLVS